MAVNISPATALGFNRPFTDPVKRTMLVTNNNVQPVAFKVKTTAPKAYCVRPNSGRIEPGESVEIQVILQGMREDPPPGTKCKDKFLVQSMTITPDMVNTSFAAMWGQAETDPSAHTVHSERIKVIFLPPEGIVEEPIPADTTFLSVNDSRYDTVRSIPSPQRANGTTVVLEQVTAPPHEEVDRGTSPAPDFQVAHDEHPSIQEVITQPPIIVAPAPAPAPVPPASPVKAGTTSSEQFDDLRSKLVDAQSEIDRLRGLLVAPAATESATSGFRRRNASGSPTEVGEVESDQSRELSTVENGVPPQVVAIISLLVFTLTYLFF